MGKQSGILSGITCFLPFFWACSKAPTTYYPLQEGRS
jgi:hypothetical protein